ncbi:MULTISPECIES: glutathione S-transferase family protein [Providencia]|uniref:glutathione S-transferase family protein n=1 Tax=Providencia TaxID=586 RepID=UPI001B39C766|nr:MULTISPECIES: glutathione S-transferase family protein [Providencia]EJD6081103.1 glutathione S-transferase family protein [Providencia rettgeri]EJD6601986.1 glutathione S-transferase family protein [Providencia rettgeri]ELR5255527.1 glutathione S-transferase family protein [Providencia rettgeri]MBQ0330250.1 glutathione S-transferase family protein [Providencia rettgeri]WOC02277.1 glutathione S-transferase family protein [Providencia sp. PROV024]
MLTVWGRKTSSNVQALMWCIGELELPYKRLDFGHRYGGTDTDEFYRLNPNRTVPVIQDGCNPPLWETGAILRYLANRYAKGNFWPDEILARTEVDRWMEWSKLNVALAFTAPIFWQVARTPKESQDINSIKLAIDKFENNLMIAEEILASRNYLASDDFSLADIQFGHVLYRYYDIDIKRKLLPYIEAYYKRLLDRPAYREHVAISYDELRPAKP